MFKTVLLGSLIKEKKAHSQTGPFGTQLKASEYTEEGIPVINVRNIGMGDLKKDNLEYLSDKKSKELKSHKLINKDIVFGRKGAVERHSLITTKEEGWIQGSDCIRLRFFTNEINPKFISYFFRTQRHQQWMINLGSFGATMGSLNQDIISKIRIPLIPIEAQNFIASILGNYDDLIENNNQRIQLLEEMASEIYKEWFVRLRFPGYENAVYRDKNGKQVDRESDGAFPGGWEKKPVNTFNSFSILKSKLKRFEGAKKYLATADVSKIMIVGEGEEITWENKPSRAQLKPELYSVFFARMSNTYKVINFTDTNKELIQQLALSSGFLGLKAINKLCLPHLFSMIKSDYFHKHKDLYANGATQVSLTNEGFAMIKMVEPTIELIEKFGKLVMPFFEEINTLLQKNQVLQKTRDLLLPRLISGKLSVEHLLNETNERKETIRTAAEPAAVYETKSIK